jgi:hypothetical protein
MKKIPYGIANFEKIREGNTYYYVDKTRYIAELENLGSSYHFFLRPRRFGKSLFVSMLEHYYDPCRAAQFDELFGDTWIGRNPTALRNKLPVLKLNFSGIPTHTTEEKIEYSFTLVLRAYIETFFARYGVQAGIPKETQQRITSQETAGDILNLFCIDMAQLGVKYLLLIDEYDNFANNVLIHHGKEKYQALTHRGGFLRSFFAAIKNATEARTVERLFVTGVSPLVLSDVTSGMNIGDNLSFMVDFDTAAGFTQAETEAMLDYYIGQCSIPQAERADILDIFSINYGNYAFSENTDSRVYNSDMILYFFNKYLQGRKIPSVLLDENVRIDYGKLSFLLIESRKLNGNFNVLTEVMDQGSTPVNLVHSFALADIIEADKFKSFLYYLGLLTVEAYRYESKFSLAIPNDVIRTMHFDYIRRALQERYELRIDVDFLATEFDELAFHGRWQRLLDYILARFYEAASIRDFIFREQGIKSFLLAYLNVTPLYFVRSEPELNHGYADLFLQKNPYTTDKTRHEYLIELKYLTDKELQAPGAVERCRAEAAAQLERYAAGRQSSCTLHPIILLASAREVLVLEELTDSAAG